MMECALLTAVKREEKAKKARANGFIPAIIYGQGLKSEPVKFEKLNLMKVLRKYGERSKIKILVDKKEKIAIIKDIDKHPTTNEIQHVDIQMVKEDETVNWEIPIQFIGMEALEAKKLSLNVNFNQLEVVGKVKDIPDVIEINIEDKDYNDIITIKDLNLNPNIRFMKDPDTILASFK